MLAPRHQHNPPDEVMFAQLNPDSKKYFVSFEKKLSKIIEDETGIDPLKNTKRQDSPYPFSRQLFMNTMRERTNKTLSSIGSIFNIRHDQVIYSIRSVNNRIDTDKNIRAMYDRINEKAKLLK